MISNIVFWLNFEDEINQRQREILSERIYRNYSGEIAFGIFKGLKINSGSAWSGARDTGSKILGLYENQILKWIESRTFDLFIDIGAADGYYALGLLHSKRATRAVTFEISEKDRGLISQAGIKLNLLENIEILGKANEEQIIDAFGKYKKVLILMDIEGEEFTLITSTLLEAARNCHFLIEMHDKSNGFHEKNLIELCKKTHAIEILEGNERIFPTDTYLTTLTDNQKSLLVSEGRQYSMKWLALSPQVD